MKKTILLSGAAAILLFAAGMGSGWLLFHQEEKAAPEREIRIRVADGNVEWSAGGEWNQAGTVAQLQEGDPYAARASWGEYPAAESTPSAFTIGEVPKAEEPSRPSTPSKRPSRPSGGGNTGGNSGGGGAAQTPTTPSKPQDGEDVGWSDDLL